jgi:2,4-dienoyl-CoA reductase-like NADH-dependent reductase (Old Yellow Enzyme family)
MYDHLLAPLAIGPLTLANRIVSTAHQTTLVEDGLPTDDFVAYHEARARGGVGLICIEATAVHPGGLLTGHTIAGFDPRVVERLGRVADAVHGPGGRLFAQVFHGGREQIEDPPRSPAVAPSAVPSQRFKTEPRALGSAEIEDILAHHELVARHAREAGLDGLELCASHGYLPTQFLSERTNRRDDAWGGTPERRLRYVQEALRALRRGAGDGLAVGIRLSVEEALPEGRSVAESGAILRVLADEGLIDYAGIVIGDSAGYRGSAFIVPPPPVGRDLMRGPALALRDGLGVPLIVASRIDEPAVGDALIAEGAADAVGMNRALIADPDLPRKLLEGREDERILCIGCNQGCIGRYHLGLSIACLQNPRTGRERTLPPTRRTPAAGDGPRVVVVGAGPAGLSAAVEAAAAGALVVLCESRDRVGGQLALASASPGHAELYGRFADDWLRRLAAAGVELQLDRPVLDDDERLAEADSVVLATGARPYSPGFTDARLAIVDAWDALAEPASVAGPALVADWGGGWTGLAAAESLAAAGVATHLAIAAPTPGETVHQYQRVFTMARLEELGVALHPFRELATGKHGLVLRSIWSHRPEPLPPDVRSAVLALGRVPEEGLALALAARGVAHERVGDCRGPRSAEEAVLEGREAGLRAAAVSSTARAPR